MSKRSSFSSLDLQIDGDVIATYENIKKVADIAPSVKVVANLESYSNIDIVGNDINNVDVVANAIKTGEGISAGGGQFLGTSIVKGVQYMAQKSAPNENIIVPEGMNAFSIESFELEAGSTLTIEPNATYKVL